MKEEELQNEDISTYVQAKRKRFLDLKKRERENTTEVSKITGYSLSCVGETDTPRVNKGISIQGKNDHLFNSVWKKRNITGNLAQ